MPWHQLLIWSSSMLRKSWNQPELTVNIQKIILESFNLFKPKHILTCMFSFMFLSSQATFPKSYCGGSDFCRSVGPSGCCGLLDNILHPEFGCWSYKAGSVAAEGHLAIGMFGLILSDTGSSAETTAIRLVGLACVCFLLGIGTTSAKPDRHIEDKIKMLERRLREIEKNKMD